MGRPTTPASLQAADERKAAGQSKLTASQREQIAKLQADNAALELRRVAALSADLGTVEAEIEITRIEIAKLSNLMSAAEIANKVSQVVQLAGAISKLRTDLRGAVKNRIDDRLDDIASRLAGYDEGCAIIDGAAADD